jgi:hypothetical protein
MTTIFMDYPPFYARWTCGWHRCLPFIAELLRIVDCFAEFRGVEPRRVHSVPYILSRLTALYATSDDRLDVLPLLVTLAWSFAGGRQCDDAISSKQLLVRQLFRRSHCARSSERLRRVIALLGGARAVASPPLGRINWEEGKSCASQLR